MGNTAQLANLSGAYAAGGINSFKNRIINGAMMIDQRNAGALVSNTNTNPYTLDRWIAYNSTGAAKYTVQQSSVAPPGFTKSLLVTSTSAYSLGATDFFMLDQVIEGYNIADLGWGAAGAATVTLSFWVRSSLTGTFGGSLKSYTGTAESYPFTYTINTANTWEQKSVVVPGPTSVWSSSTTNGGGVEVIFGLGVGSTYSAAAGSWAVASSIFSATGATSVVGTNGATFYITGVQLEKGSTATSFDYRPYGTELQLCQRYYARFNSLGGAYRGVGVAVCESATSISAVVKYPVSMRSGPTASGSNLACYDGGNIRAITAFATQYSGSDGMNINLTVGGGGLTQTRPATLIGDSGGTGYFDLSAEL